MAVIEEEERRNREELYTGDSSLGKRALQLVLMKKQLEQNAVELREMMIYNAPPELGALWTDVSDMMKSMGAEQKILLKRKLRKEEKEAERRRVRMKAYMEDMIYGGVVFVIAIVMILLMWYISIDRKQRWPELEPDVVKAKQEERKRIRLMELQEWQENQKREEELYSKRNQEFINQQRGREAIEDKQNEETTKE